ncbi:hypothetical protein ACFVXW_09935 [Streptomyces sp. NPDC058251]|uniref:hypothetical protein n=1 Tax=Streptomyces sp. NPDC058251 TaxID=3346404 RepID=UPI0036E880CB
MAEAHDIEAVVFDILGTMVDEPGGLRAAIRDAVPASDDASVARLLTVWQELQSRESPREARECGNGIVPRFQALTPRWPVELVAALTVTKHRRTWPQPH